MYSASDPTSGSELPGTTECSRIERVSSRGSWPNQRARDRARFVPEVPQKGGNRRPRARSLSSFVFLDTTGFRVCSSLPVARPTADLSQASRVHPRWGLSPPPVAQGSEASPAARNALDSARIPRASKLLICGLFQKGRVLAQDGHGCGFRGLRLTPKDHPSSHPKTQKNSRPLRRVGSVANTDTKLLIYDLFQKGPSFGTGRGPYRAAPHHRPSPSRCAAQLSISQRRRLDLVLGSRAFAVAV